MNDIIDITPTAWEKIKGKIDATNEKNNSVRIDIRTKGCSGYSYTFELTNDMPVPGEKYIKNGEYQVIISSYAELFISGATLDYVVKDKFTQGFDFINESEKSRCGCGESFTI